jgi:hypothetical protein
MIRIKCLIHLGELISPFSPCTASIQLNIPNILCSSQPPESEKVSTKSQGLSNLYLSSSSQSNSAPIHCFPPKWGSIRSSSVGYIQNVPNVCKWKELFFSGSTYTVDTLNPISRSECAPCSCTRDRDHRSAQVEANFLNLYLALYKYLSELGLSFQLLTVLNAQRAGGTRRINHDHGWSKSRRVTRRFVHSHTPGLFGLKCQPPRSSLLHVPLLPRSMHYLAIELCKTIQMYKSTQAQAGSILNWWHKSAVVELKRRPKECASHAQHMGNVPATAPECAAVR